MDPLSGVLSLLKPRSYAFRGLDAGRHWSIAFPPGEGIKCYAVLSGGCLLSVDGVDAPLRLGTGDCVLLPRGHAFRFGSGTGALPLDALAVFPAVGLGNVLTIDGGGACFGIGGYFALHGASADFLLGMLPPVVHFRTEEDKASLRWILARLMQELREPQPGAALIAEHLAQMLLIQTLRLHLAERPPMERPLMEWPLMERPRAEQPGRGTGWLFALGDARMGAAIAALHADPGRRWTLQALAQVAGLSRSGFAARFRATVGEPAMQYLLRWRMLVAVDRLAQGGASVAAVAFSLGYGSESAFGVAFKRVVGIPPRRFDREREG